MKVSATLHAPARSLAAAVGLPLGAYRRDHVQACVMRVMRREQIAGLQTLIARVDEDARLRTRLRRSIAVCTTGLFRDPRQLRWLDAEVMPGLTAGARAIRAWSAGCAAGEEAFTLATMLEWHGMLGRCEVVGSDILEESLEEAATGVVGGAHLPQSLRSRVRWDRRDLTAAGAPDGEFEIVLCRNLISLLNPVAAEWLGRTLAGSVAVGGVLMLAREEQIDGPEKLGLDPIGLSAYRRIR